jgi:hypothetical protein
MPIIEEVLEGDLLNQGDILRGVTLFATQDSANPKGGDAAKAPFPLCLVVSRPCAIAHKQNIVVAGIDKYPDSVPKDMNSFEKVLDYLTSARDGETSPDVFYLGQIPTEKKGRYRAKLDSLFTIQIPSEPELLAAFVREKRIAKLNQAFCRSLHTRLFTAFATLGFDDNGWLSTDDLDWLVKQGLADVAEADSAVGKLLAQQSSLHAEGKAFEERPLTRAKEALAELKAKIQPFEEELTSRLKN